MEVRQFELILEELAPFREQLRASLLEKNLNGFSLPDLTEIMLPMDGLLEVCQHHGLENFVQGLEFINDLLGQLATESIGSYTGMTYVLNLYEFLDDALDALGRGEDKREEFSGILGRFQHMLEGMNAVSEGHADYPEEVLQDLPTAEVLEDGSAGDFINEVKDGLEAVEETVLSLEEDPSQKSEIDAVFRIMHTIKGTSGFLGMPVIGKVAHRTEDILGEIRDGKRSLTPSVFELLFISIDCLKNLVDQLKNLIEGSLVAPVNLGDFYQALQYCIDHPQGGAPEGTPVKEEARETAPREPEPTLPSKESKGDSSPPEKIIPKRSHKSQQAAPGGKKIDETLKVSATKLDELSNLVGEMVVALSLLSQNPVILEEADRSVLAQLDHLEKITESLRNKVLGIRMFPIGSVFSKLSRQVRDLSHKSGKNINLVLKGSDTLVDKSIIDNIYAPLMHLVRNSIDHGIEPAEERGNKDPQGNVTITAQHLGDAIDLVIQDDGRGLDVEKLMNKAVERGLARRDREYTDKEVYNFIFLPGFSTAQVVTDISGRGVGMDVVKKSVEQLRGKIAIESAKGVGTTFRLKMPLTTSIIEGLVVAVGGSRFILPILDVNQTITPDQADLKGYNAQENEFFLLQGETIPIVRLFEMYHLTPKVTDPVKGVIIVCNVGLKRYGILVDELLHRQQIVIQKLGDRFAKVRGITGGTILGDGRVGLILDPVSLINELFSKKKQSE